MALKYANPRPEADEHIPSDLSFGSETFAEVLTDVENIHINPIGGGEKLQVDAYFQPFLTLPLGAVLGELTTSFQRMSMHRAVEKFLPAQKPKKLRNPAALQPTTEKWRCSG